MRDYDDSSSGSLVNQSSDGLRRVQMEQESSEDEVEEMRKSF